MKKILVQMFAATVVFAAAVSAHAAEMTSPNPLILQEGPGTHYGAGQKIAANASVHVGVCNSVWCHIRTGQDEGWVPTEKLSPQLAREMKKSLTAHKINAARATNGAGGAGAPTARRQLASTTMVIRMRIISKEEGAARGLR